MSSKKPTIHTRSRLLRLRLTSRHRLRILKKNMMTLMSAMRRSNTLEVLNKISGLNLTQPRPILRLKRKTELMMLTRKSAKRFRLLKSSGRTCSTRLRRLRLTFWLSMMNSSKPLLDWQFFKIINWLLSSNINPSRPSNYCLRITKWKLKLRPWREILRFTRKLRKNWLNALISVKKSSRD